MLHSLPGPCKPSLVFLPSFPFTVALFEIPNPNKPRPQSKKISPISLRCCSLSPPPLSTSPPTAKMSLQPVHITQTPFFYAAGNTPPVCLTQSLPPEQGAALLLLCCVDFRNILFTIYNGAGTCEK